ncbi:hypothetical protein [Pantoea sp. 18069]|uniref:hypothetical protein n=1 Tax=Pantoea sp. 18069 TaxID=2681415 RepID=UPI001357309F|nr:hypothetical protein [Pantoea sp. 18069]
MDGLTFTAEMVKAGAWPSAVVAMALIFREQLRALLARLSKGRLGPAEFEFEQELQVLAAQSAGSGSAFLARANAGTLPPEGSARNAILVAWRDLEQAVHGLAEQPPAQDLVLYRQLGALRDQVSHGLDFSPSPESASAYVQLARGLQARIAHAQAGRGKGG